MTTADDTPTFTGFTTGEIAKAMERAYMRSPGNEAMNLIGGIAAGLMVKIGLDWDKEVAPLCNLANPDWRERWRAAETRAYAMLDAERKELAYPSDLREQAARILTTKDEKLPVVARDLRYYSFPKAYGSTAGPFGGIGGQMITSFQIEAFEDDMGRSVWFCGGRQIAAKDDGALYGFIDREELDEFERFKANRDELRDALEATTTARDFLQRKLDDLEASQIHLFTALGPAFGRIPLNPEEVIAGVDKLIGQRDMLDAKLADTEAELRCVREAWRLYMSAPAPDAAARWHELVEAVEQQGKP